MKGRNPLVIFFVIGIAALVAFLFFYNESNKSVEVVGQGTEKAEKRLAEENTKAPDSDALPTEFKKLIGDVQALSDKVESLEAVKDTVEVLKSENKLKDGAILGLKQGMEPLLKNDKENQPNTDNTDPKPEIKPPETKDNAKIQGLLDSIVPPLNTDEKKQTGTNRTNPNEIVWIKPLDSGYVEDKRQRKSSSYLTNNPSSEANKEQPGLLDEVGSKTKNQLGLESGKDPRFTIPHGSIIADSMAVTALVGRIPVKGNLQDPWKFKVSTGQKIIMPNDHELQGLEKTIIEGTAIGDLNLRCVTGRVETMTFIFTDGRIVTHEAKNKKDGIGYISDSHANPCIPGELITNAPQIIASMSALGIGEGVAQGIADAETQTTRTTDGSTIQTVVGSHLKNAGFNGVSNGFSEVKQWFSDRIGQYFDVIYVPGGQHVDIHISEEIKIDYDPMGRKVQYDTHSDAAHGYMD
ncbi:MAG: TIGR03752 family integrating conjugative element protein [Hydrogenovibrio crunogenus]|nr:TIGR03752 family integrating conjugative element protein [Hydrogenovibrio crunogenus]